VILPFCNGYTVYIYIYTVYVYANQGCVYLIENTIKKKVIYSLLAKLSFRIMTLGLSVT